MNYVDDNESFITVSEENTAIVNKNPVFADCSLETKKIIKHWKIAQSLQRKIIVHLCVLKQQILILMLILKKWQLLTINIPTTMVIYILVIMTMDTCLGNI